MPGKRRRWLKSISKSCLAGILCSLLLLPAAKAEESSDATVEGLSLKIEALRNQYEREIEELRRQVEELKAQSLKNLRGGGPADAKQALTGEKAQQQGTTGAGEAQEGDTGEVRRRPERREGTETILVEAGGVLIPQGTLTIEPSFNYTHFSRNLITISGFTLFEAIVIGEIVVDEIKRDILTGTLRTRYGLFDWLQMEVEIPYLYRRDRLVRPAATGEAPFAPVFIVDDYGWGDIQASASLDASYLAKRWFPKAYPRWFPDIVFNVKGKSRTGRDPYDLDTEVIAGRALNTELPTGTGHYGFSTGVTAVKAVDPVVFFATFNYFWNFRRDIGGIFGEIDPGDSLEYILGMAVALNEQVSLNFSFQNIFTGVTKQEGVKLPDSELNAATFFAGASWALSRYVSLFGTVGIGLTEDSPDFQAQLNVPISFNVIQLFRSWFKD